MEIHLEVTQMSFNLKRIAKFTAMGAVPALAIAGFVSGVGASAIAVDDVAPVALLAPPAPPAPPAPAPPAPESRSRSRSDRDESDKRAFLGVMLDVDEDGVMISAVMDETPAEEAGLRSGDRIVSIGGKKVEEYEDLVDAMRAMEPGQKVDVVVERNGSEKTFDVTLGEKTVRKRITMIHPGHHDGDQDIHIWGGPRMVLGVEVHPMSADLRRSLGATEDAGVLVNKVHEETPAAASGIKAGDIITAVDGRPVRRPGDIRRALMENEPGDTVPITVIRDGGEKTLDVTLQERDEERSNFGPMFLGGDHGVRAFAFHEADGDDFHGDFDFDFDFDWDDEGFGYVMSEGQQEELQQKLREFNEHIRKEMKQLQEKMQLQQENLKESQEEIRKRMREMSERDRDRPIRARQVNAVYDI